MSDCAKDDIDITADLSVWLKHVLPNVSIKTLNKYQRGIENQDILDVICLADCLRMDPTFLTDCGIKNRVYAEKIKVALGLSDAPVVRTAIPVAHPLSIGESFENARTLVFGMEEVLTPKFLAAVRMDVLLHAYDSDLDVMIVIAVEQRSYAESDRLIQLQSQVQYLRLTLGDSIGSASSMASDGPVGLVSELLGGCGRVIANLEAAEREAAGMRDSTTSVVDCADLAALSSRLAELKVQLETLQACGLRAGQSLSEYASSRGVALSGRDLIVGAVYSDQSLLGLAQSLLRGAGATAGLGDADACATMVVGVVRRATEQWVDGCNSGSLQDLIIGRYGPVALRAVGYHAEELKVAGLGIHELRVAGFSVQELQVAGFSDEDVHETYKFVRSDKDIGAAVKLWLESKERATAQYGDISKWDVSTVTTMRELFKGDDAFNDDIGAWNVSAVTDMSSMFLGASSFNQDIGDWNISAVADMGSMFHESSCFSKDLSSWKIAKGTTVDKMFDDSFNKAFKPVMK